MPTVFCRYFKISYHKDIAKPFPSSYSIDDLDTSIKILDDQEHFIHSFLFQNFLNEFYKHVSPQLCDVFRYATSILRVQCSMQMLHF